MKRERKCTNAPSSPIHPHLPSAGTIRPFGPLALNFHSGGEGGGGKIFHLGFPQKGGKENGKPHRRKKKIRKPRAFPLNKFSERYITRKETRAVKQGYMPLLYGFLKRPTRTLTQSMTVIYTHSQNSTCRKHLLRYVLPSVPQTRSFDLSHLWLQRDPLGWVHSERGAEVTSG